MPIVGEALRVYYVSRDRATSLADVQLFVFKPNGLSMGPYDMDELPGSGGVYYCDFIDSDISGNYLFIANSASRPKRSEQSYHFSLPEITPAEKAEILSGIRFMVGVEGGSWELVPPNSLIMKNQAGTVIAEFKTYNEAGLPDTNGVVKCVRV